MTLEELSDHTHNGMMNHALHSVAALFEADGWGPCDSIKAANELLKPAWDAWSTLIERVAADDRKITALEIELAAIRSVQDWQDIETSPKDGTPVLMDNLTVKIWVDTSHEEEVLVSQKGRRSTYETRVVKDGYWDDYRPEDDYLFTKWMPLPAPPSDKRGGE